MKPASLPQRALDMSREHGISIDDALFALACQEAITNPTSDEPSSNARVWQPKEPEGRMVGADRNG
jgi:hypothetical protein